MKTISVYIAFVVFIVLLASCATQNILVPSPASRNAASAADSVFRYNAAYQYRLQKDDKINISVWDNDDLSVGSIYGIYNSNEVYGKWLMLDNKGDVSVPKLGDVHLAGLTVMEAKEKLRQAFVKWILNPIVEIKVLNKEVTILGETKSPGRFLLEKDNNTLLELIGRAGDFDFYANKKKVQVIRIVDNQPVSVEIDMTRMENFAKANMQIHPGDIIYIPSRRGKVWDKRAGSIIVPIATIISSAAILSKF